MSELIFHESPEIEIATNKFINVPVILEFDDMPLIEVIRAEKAGFTTSFEIYNKDGIYIAKVKGSQIYRTEEGKSAGMDMRYEDKLTVCELEGKTVFEIRRKESAALKTEAELYTPKGAFVKCNDSGLSGYLTNEESAKMNIGQLNVFYSTISNCRVGISITSSGGLILGKN